MKLNVSLPESWSVPNRAVELGFKNSQDYLRDLVRRDLARRELLLKEEADSVAGNFD